MNGEVRLAEEEDAEQMVNLFLNEYDTYFGKFSDPEKMQKAISAMHSGIEKGSPWAGVFVVDDNGEINGVSAEQAWLVRVIVYSHCPEFQRKKR